MANTRRFLALAALLALLPISAIAQTAPRIVPPSDWGQKDRVWSYIGAAEGGSEAEALHSLLARAVALATGRFYFGEEKFIARNLLERYLDRYAENFIASREILERRQSGANVWLRVRANVWLDRLFLDLKEKRFVYAPKTKPVFSVFLSETMDGSPLGADSPVARKQIQDSLAEKGLSVYPESLPEPPPNTDPAASADQLTTACREAQKAGVEVIVSGALVAAQAARENLYYSELTFYEAEITLNLVRADDGAILTTVRSPKVRVARRKGQEALSESIAVATRQALDELVEFYQQNWVKDVHEGADYRVMLTDVSPADVDAFIAALESLNDSVKVYPRNYFGRVAVLNFDYQGDRKLIESFFRSTSYPRFRVIPEGDRRFELEAVRQ